jgi:hypothetical protein
LPNLAAGEGGSVCELAAVIPYIILCVAFGLPPTHQSRGRRETCGGDIEHWQHCQNCAAEKEGDFSWWSFGFHKLAFSLLINYKPMSFGVADTIKKTSFLSSQLIDRVARIKNCKTLKQKAESEKTKQTWRHLYAKSKFHSYSFWH